MLQRIPDVDEIDYAVLTCQFARALNDQINAANMRAAIECGCDDCLEVRATIEDPDDRSRLETGALDDDI